MVFCVVLYTCDQGPWEDMIDGRNIIKQLDDGLFPKKEVALNWEF